MVAQECITRTRSSGNAHIVQPHHSLHSGLCGSLCGGYFGVQLFSILSFIEVTMERCCFERQHAKEMGHE